MLVGDAARWAAEADMPPRCGGWLAPRLGGGWLVGFIAAVALQNRPEDASCSSSVSCLGMLTSGAMLDGAAKGFRMRLENPKERSCGV